MKPEKGIGRGFCSSSRRCRNIEGLYERMLVISGKTGETDETLDTIERQFER